MPPEHENVASSPPGRSSFSASRLTSLYARAARSACAAVGANFGGSSTHEIEGGAAVAQLAQFGERVRLAPLRAVGRQRRIEREVLAGEGERLGRAVDRDDARRAAGERRQREAAGVAEHVEHFASGGETPHGGAIRALVEIETRLLAGRRRRRGRRARPRRTSRRSGSAPCATPTRGGRPSSLRTSASERSYTHAAPVAATSAATIASRQRSAPADDELQHDRVRVAIGDHAGQAVGLAVDQPAARVAAHPASAREPRPRARRGARRNSASIARRRGSNVQTRARICEAGEYAACARNAPSAESTVTVSPDSGAASADGDRAGEDPGVALPQRFLAPRLEPQHGIGVSQARHRRGGRPRT